MACLNCQGSKSDRGCCLSVNLLAKPMVAQRIQKFTWMNLSTSCFCSCDLDGPGCWHIRRSQSTRCIESCGGKVLKEGMKLWFAGAGTVTSEIWLNTDAIISFCESTCLMVIGTTGCCRVGHWSQQDQREICKFERETNLLKPYVVGWLEVMKLIDFPICRRWSKRWRPIRKL